MEYIHAKMPLNQRKWMEKNDPKDPLNTNKHLLKFYYNNAVVE